MKISIINDQLKKTNSMRKKRIYSFLKQHEISLKIEIEFYIPKFIKKITIYQMSILHILNLHMLTIKMMPH